MKLNIRKVSGLLLFCLASLLMRLRMLVGWIFYLTICYNCTYLSVDWSLFFNGDLWVTHSGYSSSDRCDSS